VFTGSNLKLTGFNSAAFLFACDVNFWGSITVGSKAELEQEECFSGFSNCGQSLERESPVLHNLLVNTNTHKNNRRTNIIIP